MINLFTIEEIKQKKIGTLIDRNLLLIKTILIFIILGCVGFKSNNWTIQIQLIPFYVSLIIFGLPHGAADHLCMWGLIKKKSWYLRCLSIFGYLIISMLYLLVWMQFPLVATLFFLLITIYHWGRADTFYSAIINNHSSLKRYTLLAITHTLMRGCLPIILPGYLNETIYHAFLTDLSSYRSNYISFNLIFDNEYFLFISIFLIFLHYTLSLIISFKNSKSEIIFDFFETSLLVTWFISLPVIWSVGFYFVFWHGFRHSLRLMAYDNLGSQSLKNNNKRLYVKRWTELTGLITIISILGLVILFKISSGQSYLYSNFLVILMVGISILTLPHCLLVEIMDRNYSKLVK